MYSALQSTTPSAKSSNLTASALVCTGAGLAVAIIVSSHTTGTIKLWASLTATQTVLLETYTYATGSQVIPLHGMRFETGLYATLTNTQSITVVYNQ
jgi:hypothetical protein